jgi:hypothetical protein
MTWDDPLTVRYILPGSWYSDLHPHAMWLFPAQWFFLALCGVFMLRGLNWTRWILVAWVGYHFFQSLAHTQRESEPGSRPAFCFFIVDGFDWRGVGEL